MLRFNIITETPAWDALKDEWNDLLAESITHVPFLRHEFLQDWWKTLGGGEWPQGELAIITAHEADRLIGIAPLFRTQNRDGQSVLMFIGSFEIVDYLDFIVRENDLDEFLTGLFTFLQSDQAPSFDVLDLYNILNVSPSLAAVEKHTAGLPWRMEKETLQPARYIPIPGDWETYLAGIDKKQRHEIRRKMRRAEESGYQTDLYFTTDPERVENDIRCFLRLMAQDPEKEKFLTPLMREQMASTIRCAFENDCLQLAFLEIGGERASAYLSFKYLNKLWVYNSGVNRQLVEYSPGWVLLGYLLKWCNDNGIAEFDFLRGEEEYKTRFGGADRFVNRVKLSKA